MAGPLGVYVHIPFCAVRCDYCAFATWTDRAHLLDAYVDACVTDLERRRRAGELVEATTVYFGGGTPSLVPAADLARILDAVPRVADAEVTVECNPESVEASALAVLRRAGVTRISLGVQSARPHVLAALGRTQDPASVARAVDAIVGAGMASFNLDVIAGAPGERGADFEATLDTVLGFDPPHVSVYLLAVEPGTPLARRVATGRCEPPHADVQADRYLVADARCRAAGLEWYEISNWARPGHECRHNLGYWTGAECVAIGAAAHGLLAGVRWWNVRRPEDYIARIAAGRSPAAGSERLDDARRAAERFALALRTRGGVPVTDPVAVAELEAAGLVEQTGSRVVLTPAGRLLATEVTLRLWPGVAEPGAGTRYDGVPTPDPQGTSSGGASG